MKKIIFIFLLACFIIPVSAQAQLSCTVKVTCSSGEVDVFHMARLSNAHAELPTQSNYDANKVCCGGVTGLDTLCGDPPQSEVVLRLRTPTNSHVQEDTVNTYTNNACLSIAAGTVDCNYVSGGGPCSSGYTCLATISSASNAHVADCDGSNDFSIKVCCMASPPLCTLTSASISPNCAGGTSPYCEVGETISMSGTFTGTCTPADFFQIDALGPGCSITYTGGQLTGINTSTLILDNGFVDGTWTIPSIPAACSGKTVSATAAALYVGGPPGTGTMITFTDSVGGSFTFKDVLEPNTVLNPYVPDPTNDNTPTYTGTATDASSNIVTVQYRINGGGWQNAQPSDGSFNSPSEGFTFTPSALADGTYTFETRAQDAAGNWETSYASDTLTIDTSPPICNSIQILPASRVPWTNQSFTTSWFCSDSSGISIYNVQYNITRTDGSGVQGWKDWINRNSPTNQQFGPSSPVTLQNNYTYFFRVNATDNVGNTGPYSAVVNTTFDNEPPNIAFTIIDDKIGKKVTITSSAWDNISGIFNHTIICTVINPNLITFVQCKQAAPFGGMSNQQVGGTQPCQISQSYDDQTEINCVIKAEDRAGNTHFEYPFFTLTIDHPLVKILEPNVFISIGEKQYSRVSVRNLKSVPDEVNVTILGAPETTYPLNYVGFLEASPVSWISLPDRRNITVSLNPYEQKIVYLGIESTDIGDYSLEVEANSKANPTLIDRDSMSITIGFPASFPGVELWSIMAILSIACLAYFKGYIKPWTKDKQ